MRARQRSLGEEGDVDRGPRHRARSSPPRLGSRGSRRRPGRARLASFLRAPGDRRRRARHRPPAPRERDAINMRPAEDAIEIDTTDLDVVEVVAQIEQIVQARHLVNRVDAAVWAVGRYTIGTLVRDRRAAPQLRRRASADERRRGTQHQPLPPDRPARLRPLLAAPDLLPREGRGPPRAGAGAAGPELRDDLRPPRRVGPRRCGGCARSSATGTHSGSSPRGPASSRAFGRVQPGAAMAALQEDVPASPRPRSTARSSGRSATGTRSRPRGGAAPLRRPAERGEGLPGGVGRDRAADPRPPRLARRGRCARPAAGRRRHDERDGARDHRHGGDRRLPNVGKPTPINRLTETRQAVVHETLCVTRDRKELLADWNGKHFLLIDTGGVDDLATDPFSPSIARQARAAIEEADLVLFVVDARHGITPGDEEPRPRCGPRASRCSCSRTRSTIRAATSRRSSSTSSASAT